MEFIDLRSDTVTLPTREMLEAILMAKLGDDQYGEDETVNKLQEKAADKLGKEQALLVSSGTQANLVSVMSHTSRGDAAILEAESHIMYYEAAGISGVAGVMPITVKGNMGALNPADVEDRLIQQHRIHQPKVKLICLENTHNRAGGTCITPQQTHEIAELAQKYNVKLYVDGARIFNAAIALNVDVKSLTKEVDSVSFCLSKGLSAPVGSLILGDREFIDRARVNRQRLGGAMRQAGIIAAPGLIALETMIDRLKEDHENAKTLAKGLVDLGLSVDLRRVQTNIVMIDVSTLGMTSEQFTSKLTELKVKASIYGKTTVRMVTHRGIDASHIKYVIEAVSNIVRMKNS